MSERGPLLDVNALVAAVWDSHVHHDQMVRWFREHGTEGWATCPVTESGFVRVSSNPKVLPAPVAVRDARRVLGILRDRPSHVFVHDDVSMTDPDVPELVGHRQVTDAHLLVLARRHGRPLLTFDRGLASLGGADVTLLPSP